MKYLRRQELDKVLIEMGLTKSIHGGYRWVLYRERAGVLKCPRDPISGQRIFTEQQIKEIAEAFSPGGKGRWGI